MADESKPKRESAQANGAGDPKVAAARLAAAAGGESPEGEATPESEPAPSSESEGEAASSSEGKAALAAPDSARRFEKKRPSGKSPWPSAHKSEHPSTVSIAPPAAAVPARADWGEPLDRFDRAWTKLESRLAAGVLIAEILTLVFWIGIRALSSTGHGGPGMVFRALVMALVFGLVAHRAAKKQEKREAITTAAVVLGLFAGTRMGELGTAYFSNLFAWLQNASVLVFVGGVGELARRLTLWLALLGASLATAQGKHINLDVMMRFLSPRARIPVAVLGWVAAAVVAISASWGFFDYVAVEELRASPTIPCPDASVSASGAAAKRCAAPPGAKIDAVLGAASRGAFLSGRQLALDVRSFPRVITGTAYNRWLTPAAWNQWLRDGGWESHFKAADVKAMELPEDGTMDFRNPSVTSVPGGTEDVAGLLVPLFNLVFAFGLLMIGLRFILRSLLAISGWVKVDPAAAHADEELAHAHEPSPAAELAEAALKGTQS